MSLKRHSLTPPHAVHYTSDIQRLSGEDSRSSSSTVIRHIASARALSVSAYLDTVRTIYTREHKALQTIVLDAYVDDLSGVTARSSEVTATEG